MISEEFSEVGSLLYRLDPRVKICVTLFLSFFIALTQKLLVVGAGLLLALLLLLFTHLRLQRLVSRLFSLALFIGLIWIFLPLSVPGTPLFTLGRLSMSSEGLLYAFSISLKSVAIVLIVTALLSTSGIFSVVHALEKLFLPKKLIYLTFLCFHYTHVMQREYARMRSALLIRCFAPKTNLHTYKAYAYLVGMLLVKSYDRSERIHKAMLCRGFRGTFPRLESFVLKKEDLLFLVVTTCYIIGMIWIQMWKGMEIRL